MLRKREAALINLAVRAAEKHLLPVNTPLLLSTMNTFERPRILSSRCIEFDHCRWNGDRITSDTVNALKEYADFIPVCAEMEIGLGVPREPVRLVDMDGSTRLIQHETNLDVTDRMIAFADSTLDAAGDLDGFILKSRSPSCGIKDVKVYRGVESPDTARKEAGIFAARLMERFPYLPVEDEGRLRNRRIKEHFLTRIFAGASFRKARGSGEMRELTAFHQRNKFLLMAYSQKELQELGRIVANHEKRGFNEVADAYGAHFSRALSRAPTYTATINVLMHALGYFKDSLSHEEKAFFLESLHRYREDRSTVCPNLAVFRSWIVRFGNEYLANQTFFNPFPPDLMEVARDVSHKERDYWAEK
jgi:uncharacterized protein YbgA (DUF1722 family)/uncharacterized protein YbbK (DUF523 family)